jgi:hypothetical protein
MTKDLVCRNKAKYRPSFCAVRLVLSAVSAISLYSSSVINAGLPVINSHGNFELANFKKDVYNSADIAVHHAVDSRHEWSASYTRSRTLSNAVEDVNADRTRIVRNNFCRMGWDVPDRLLSWGTCPRP